MTTISKKILVTGASGYLASWIVKLLIEQGSFDEPTRDCDIVIHTASPYFLEKPRDITKELIEPAVKGTQNVLSSVNKTRSVKRVIVTSSIVTLFNNAKDLVNTHNCKITEEGTNKNTDKTYNPYAFSKTKAEQAAWEMNQQQNHWELITVHPGAIFGPSLSNRHDSTSVNMMIQFLNGSFKTSVPNGTHPLTFDNSRSTSKLRIHYCSTKNTLNEHIDQLVECGLV
jgi:nucleoside-diphosphate-sugar epimerase